MPAAASPLSPSRHARLVQSVLLVLAVVLGGLRARELTEQDIFWQIRAGTELASTLRFPQVDTWSYTATGEPWHNVQWLSTLVLAGVFHLGGVAGLVLARCLLVAVLFWRLGGTLLRRLDPEHQLGGLLTLLPLFWVATAFRLELRSDTLVFLVFVEMQRQGLRRGPWPLVLGVVLAANLHAGTAPFVAALAVYLLLIRGWPWRRTLTWSLACVAGLLVTPYHVQVIAFWRRHFFYFDHVIMRNPDHRPFSAAEHLSVASVGWQGVVWLASCVFALLALWWRWQQLETLDDPAARRCGQRELAWLALGGVALGWQSFDRVRTIPYHVFFLAPHLAQGYQLALELLGRLAAWPTRLLAGLAVFALARQANASHVPFGFGLSRAMYPVGSTAFIEREQLQKNVYHTFAYGAYLVWYLRDYPLFVDTRETMYDGLQGAILDAFHSPAATQRILERYAVSTTLVPIPKTEKIGDLGFRDLIEEYTPSDQWALVYFDDISIVVVRRTPEHAALVAQHEYRLLRPNLPPGNFLRTRPTGDRLARYREEIARCLQDEPANRFCLKSRELSETYASTASPSTSP